MLNLCYGFIDNMYTLLPNKFNNVP